MMVASFTQRPPIIDPLVSYNDASRTLLANELSLNERTAHDDQYSIEETFSNGGIPYLEDIKVINPLDGPTPSEYAECLPDSFEALCERVPTTTVIRVRKKPMEVLRDRKYNKRGWYDKFIILSIDIGGITWHLTRTGHVLQERRSHYIMFAPSSSRDTGLNAAQNYSLESASNCELGFLHEDKLQRIDDQMQSYTMAVSGLGGSVDTPNGSINEAIHSILPDGIGFQHAPSGTGSLAALFGLHWTAIVRIFQIASRRGHGDALFNQLTHIISGDKRHLELGTPITVNGRALWTEQPRQQFLARSKEVTELKQQHVARAITLEGDDLKAVQARQEANSRFKEVTVLKKLYEAGKITLKGQDLKDVTARLKRNEKRKERKEKRRQAAIARARVQEDINVQMEIAANQRALDPAAIARARQYAGY